MDKPAANTIHLAPEGAELKRAAYSFEDNLGLLDETIQFSPAEFQAELKYWIAQQWPVQFLIRDHHGARIFRDNGVFSLMEFYGHNWSWSDETGLSILYRAEGETESHLVPWESISHNIPIQKTPQGWLLFDGWNYIQQGLVPVHLWQWKKLVPSYKFPQDLRPDHCYVDIVAYCWEHEGMQGFGFGTPHGHLAIEFGDELGNFYSVGMYMDPRSKINTKTAPAATVRAVLMSPDPYMPSHGEKTLHRYFLGRGEEGLENTNKLREHIEGIQDWRRDPTTGRVYTCGRKLYHTFDSNCGVFCSEIEQFVQEKLGATLMALNDTTAIVPHRTRVESANEEPTTWYWDMYNHVYNRGVLLAVDAAVYLAVSLPWVSQKLGVGSIDNDGRPEEESEVQTDTNAPAPTVVRKRPFERLFSLAGSVKKPTRVLFPRRMRVDQLYSPRLKNYSARFTTRPLDGATRMAGSIPPALESPSLGIQKEDDNMHE